MIANEDERDAQALRRLLDLADQVLTKDHGKRTSWVLLFLIASVGITLLVWQPSQEYGAGAALLLAALAVSGAADQWRRHRRARASGRLVGGVVAAVQVHATRLALTPVEKAELQIRVERLEDLTGAPLDVHLFRAPKVDRSPATE